MYRTRKTITSQKDREKVEEGKYVIASEAFLPLFKQLKEKGGLEYEPELTTLFSKWEDEHSCNRNHFVGSPMYNSQGAIPLTAWRVDYLPERQQLNVALTYGEKSLEHTCIIDPEDVHTEGGYLFATAYLRNFTEEDKFVGVSLFTSVRKED